MSTPDQPDTTPLTRRRLREIRATGATPVIPPASATPEKDVATEKPASEEVAPEVAAPEPPAPAPAPLPRAAEPARVPPAPEAPLDLGVVPLTRRQARAHERIRTASVPVIQPDAVPAASAAAVPPATETPHAPDSDAVREADAAQEVDAVREPDEAFAVLELPGHDAAIEGPASEDVAVGSERSADAEGRDQKVVEDLGEPEEAAPAVVNPRLGSELLAGETPSVSIPPSFDQLIARSPSSTGAVVTPNALILSQTPTATPLGPLTATGEVLITGSFDLPAGLGSVGHAHGTADGKDVDATLIDGELPPSSSPTPIAASAAISTARHAGEEIIRPPAPEKGNRLMLALVITAGVLALALVGVLVLAVTTGVFR